MAIVDPSSISIGDTIRFKTMNPHDNVVWTGVVSSICSYNVAKIYGDVDAIFQEVQRELRTLESKERLKYLLVEVLENGEVPTMRVFALEWIDKSTLEKIEENSHVDFRVYDLDPSKINDILKALTAMGYNTSVITKK